MTAPQNRSSSAGDDDSWGKLASDLFGINLNADDDLDLSDLEPPPAPAPIPAAPPIPVPPPVPTIDLSDMDFQADDDEEDDVEDDEDDLEDEDDDAGEELAESEVSPAEVDEFWDALESWDWEKGGDDAGASSETSIRPRRPEGRSSRGPRDRSAGRGGPSSGRRDSRDDRPPRPPADQPRPARSDVRDEPAEAPRRERRPEPSAERPSRGPGSVPPRQERPQQLSDDDFGSGLVGGNTDVTQRHEASKPRPRPSRPEQRTPVPAPEEDDFAAELNDHEEGDAAPEGTAEAVAEGGADEQTRRRRRRRRRPSDNREGQPAPSPAGGEEFPPELDDEIANSPEEDLDRSEAPDIAESEPRPEARGRRRRRRRPGDRPARVETTARVEEPDPTETTEPADEDNFVAEDEAVVQAVSYDDVPTWEEAISYLLKPPGDGRRDGGYRSGPPRRR